jgi:hypothetical protein
VSRVMFNFNQKLKVQAIDKRSKIMRIVGQRKDIVMIVS